MIAPEDIRKAMGKQALAACAQVFPQERPNATTEKLKEFIVVSLPYSFVNRELSEDDWWLDATVVYDIYVADKKTANNPVRVDDDAIKRLRDALIATFPMINHELGIKIVRPRIVVVSSSDENGYHYSRIQAKMTTMV